MTVKTAGDLVAFEDRPKNPSPVLIPDEARNACHQRRPQAASAMFFVNVKIGQRQLFVSRRITASVAAHCAHKAKKTMIDSATGML